MATAQGFPNTQSPFVDPQTGQIQQVWLRFLQELSRSVGTGSSSGGSTGGGGPVVSPTVGTSPFPYSAPANGSLFLSGGKITRVTVKRGSESFTTQGWFPVGWIPVAKGDVVTVTYDQAPTTFRFLPS